MPSPSICYQWKPDSGQILPLAFPLTPAEQEQLQHKQEAMCWVLWRRASCSVSTAVSWPRGYLQPRSSSLSEAKRELSTF